MDKEETNFKVNSTADGSFVMPEAPFSILDKRDSLLGEGFRRFLVDFSKTRITKQEIKAVQLSLSRKAPLEGTSRFNWKEGFYSISPQEYKSRYEKSAEAAPLPYGDPRASSRSRPSVGGKGRPLSGAHSAKTARPPRRRR